MKNRPTPWRSGRQDADAGSGARYEITMTTDVVTVFVSRVAIVQRMNR